MSNYDDPPCCLKQASMMKDLDDVVRKVFRDEIQVVCGQWAAGHETLLRKLASLEVYVAQYCHGEGPEHHEDLNAMIPGDGTASLTAGLNGLEESSGEENEFGHLNESDSVFEELGEKAEQFASIVPTMDTDQKAVPFKTESQSSWLQCLVKSSTFQHVTNLVILSNAVFMGLESSAQMRYALDHIGDGQDEQQRRTSFWCEVAFCAFFAIEIGLKAALLKANFFKGPGAGWNIFDLLVVLGTLLGTFTANTGGTNIAALRLLQIMKQMIRSSRLIRVVQECQELRVIMISIARSYMSFLTGMGILLLFMYMVAIVLVQGVASYLSDASPLAINESVKKGCVRFWGSLPKAILTLFQAVSGGGPWRDVVPPLAEAGEFYVVLFMAYISILVFALTKLLTGIFVQQAKVASDHDHAQIIEANLQKLFKNIDKDESGYITKDEFTEYLLDMRANQYFSVLQISIADADKIFAMIDIEHDNKVSISEFIRGCQKFKGYAKNVDIAVITCQIRDLSRQLNIFMHYVEERFEILKKPRHMQKTHSTTPVAERLKAIKSLDISQSCLGDSSKPSDFASK